MLPKRWPAQPQNLYAVKTHLTFIHFADSDGAGHEFGWGSAQQKDAFAVEDRALEIIRKAIREVGIERDSVIILTADHGGHDKTHGSTRLRICRFPGSLGVRL